MVFNVVKATKEDEKTYKPEQELILHSGNFANIVPGESATTIIREDQERMVSVSCKVTGSDLRTTRQKIISII